MNTVLNNKNKEKHVQIDLSSALKKGSEHPGGTNLNENDMPDRFQALPGVKTPLQQPKMNGT